MGSGYGGKSGVSEAAVGEGERVLTSDKKLGTRPGAVFKRGATDQHGTQTWNREVFLSLT